MNKRLLIPRIVSCPMVALGLLSMTACSKLDDIEEKTGKTQQAVDKAEDRLSRVEAKLDQAGGAGRFQIVVANQADRGTALFLVDTRSGESWVYRTPQGAVINGFWSSIPRVTYPDEYWQRAFSQGQPPGTNSAPAATPVSPTAPKP